MSRTHSGSPQYPGRRWEEPNFGPDLPDQDPHMDRGPRPRRGPEDFGRFPKGSRRSPSLPEGRNYARHHPPTQEDFHHRRASPCQPNHDRGFSSHRDGGFGGGGPGGDFRRRSRSPHSPLRVQRERLPSESRRRSDFSDGPPASSWRGEDQGRGRGVFCPPDAHQDHRFSGDRGGTDRSPSVKGQRRERDDHSRSGFRHEEPFREQSLGSEDFGPNPRGRPSQGDSCHSGPLVIDHGHGIGEDRGARQWDRADRYGAHEPDSKRPRISSREHFGPHGRTHGREEFKGNAYRSESDRAHWDPEKNSQDGFHPKKCHSWDRPAQHRGPNWHPPGKGMSSQRGSDWQPKDPPHFQPRHQHRQQRPGFHSQAEQSGGPEEKEESSWAADPQRDPSRERDLTREDLDPRMPRHWLQNRHNVASAVEEETLTIKVDTSRPPVLESLGRFSADRQLSLDLVGVARQRLDLLPPSGAVHEAPVHVGTFAEEIISLVHHVKEVYFKGEDVTLNQRFSAPLRATVLEGEAGEEEVEEKEELTLNQRFSAHRGFHMDPDSLLEEEEEEPQLLLQKPQRGPGDLRHNLERRRQERLEGVKVTISGGGAAPQPLLSSLSGWISTFRNQDSFSEQSDAPQWPQESGPRPKGHMGHRRGFPRANGPGRTFRRGFGLKRQNRFNGATGPGW